MNAAHDGEPRGAVFWTGLVVGLAVMAFGIGGAIANRRATQPLKLAQWLVGADLVHDLIVAPVICLTGWLLIRFTPRQWRAPLRAALVATASALVVGWIPLRGYGRIADNPSLAPLDYPTAMLTVIAVIWAGCVLWVLVAVARAKTRHHPSATSHASRAET